MALSFLGGIIGYGMAISTFAYQKFLSVGTKIVAIDRNYAAHAKELDNAIPKDPVLLMKLTSSYLANGGTIEVRHPFLSLDHEVKLAVVIAHIAQDVPESTAMDFIRSNSYILQLTAAELHCIFSFFN